MIWALIPTDYNSFSLINLIKKIETKSAILEGGKVEKMFLKKEEEV